MVLQGTHRRTLASEPPTPSYLQRAPRRTNGAGRLLTGSRSRALRSTRLVRFVFIAGPDYAVASATHLTIEQIENILFCARVRRWRAIMVQFQKGLSEADFDDLFGSEEQCHAALVGGAGPMVSICPDCGAGGHCIVKRGARRLFQCNACRKQTSVKAGTIFASSKLPLRLWFKAIYLVTQSKKGISSIELGAPAWRHADDRLGDQAQARASHVRAQREQASLKGKVQMDDAYIGGQRPGRPGRGAAGKTPFIAAVAMTGRWQARSDHPAAGRGVQQLCDR